MNQLRETGGSNQIQQAYHRNHFEDEIELIDYLRVIWKWKWLIIGGTLLCAFAFAIYSFARPVTKMYKISATIEIDSKAGLDPIDKMKSMIEYGIFNQRILNDLSNPQELTIPDHINFEVAIPNGLNILDIALKTPDVDIGKRVLNSLVKQLKEKYAQQARSELDSQLSMISIHMARIEALKEEIRLIEDVMEQTKKLLHEAQSTSDRLLAERKAMLFNTDKKTGSNNIFTDASAIQEVIDYPLILRERIASLVSKKNNISEKIVYEIDIIESLAAELIPFEVMENMQFFGSKNDLSKLRSKVELIQKSRDQITGLTVNQPPTASSIFVKNKTKRNVMLASVIGLFTMVFLAFFLEYIQKYRGRHED